MPQIIDALTRPTPRTLYAVDGEKLYEDQTARNDSELIRNALAAGVSLRGAKLMGFNLIDVNFDGQDLSDADLRFSTISKCTFKMAELQHALLHEVSFRNCDFSGANIIDVDDIKQIEIYGSEFEGARLFIKGRIVDAQITYSNFGGAAIEAYFYSSVLNNVDMRDIAGGLSFDESVLQAVDFRDAHFIHLDFAWSSVKNCNFVGAAMADQDAASWDNTTIISSLGLEYINN